MLGKFKKFAIEAHVLQFVKGGSHPACGNCKASAPDACAAAGNTGNNLIICINNINSACDSILGCQ